MDFTQGGVLMCWNSVHAERTRPARRGDVLTTHRFHGQTIGLIEAGNPDEVVCILSGTKLRIEGIPKSLRSKFDLREVEGVTFEMGAQYCDNLRFRNGAVLTINQFPPGLKVTVMMLPTVAEPPDVADEGIGEVEAFEPELATVA